MKENFRSLELGALETGKSPFFAFDKILDVRSESEFEEDAIPDAINLPCLNNQERAEVGKLYKKVSPFEARKKGAVYTCRNIARHLDIHFPDLAKSTRVLVYCWRGGERSGAFARVLSAVGWSVTRLEGGYKAFRRKVREDLPVLIAACRFRVISGPTGCGKTRLLTALAEKGEAALDLEEMAGHRGSLLGALPGTTPVSQKAFETRLWSALSTHRGKRVWLEAESAKIGPVYCPKALLEALRSAPRVELSLPQEERINALVKDYDWLCQNPEVLRERLLRLKPRYGGKEWALWQALIDKADWQRLVGRLLDLHYDPAYANASIKPVHKEKLENLSSEELDRLAGRLSRLKGGL